MDMVFGTDTILRRLIHTLTFDLHMVSLQFFMFGNAAFFLSVVFISLIREEVLAFLFSLTLLAVVHIQRIGSLRSGLEFVE